MFLISAFSILRYHPEVLLTLCAFKFSLKCSASPLLTGTQMLLVLPPLTYKKGPFFPIMWHVDSVLFIYLFPLGAHSVAWPKRRCLSDLCLHSPHESSGLTAKFKPLPTLTRLPVLLQPYCFLCPF